MLYRLSKSPRSKFFILIKIRLLATEWCTFRTIKRRNEPIRVEWKIIVKNKKSKFFTSWQLSVSNQVSCCYFFENLRVYHSYLVFLLCRQWKPGLTLQLLQIISYWNDGLCSSLQQRIICCQNGSWNWNETLLQTYVSKLIIINKCSFNTFVFKFSLLLLIRKSKKCFHHVFSFNSCLLISSPYCINWV